MASTDPRKDLPPVTAPNFLDRVRETLSTYLGARGDILNRGITLRDLVDGGLATLTDVFKTTGAGALLAAANTYTPDLTKPPVPSNFTASAALAHVIVDTDAPLFTAGHGYARTRLYGIKYTSGALPTFSQASLLEDFTGAVGTYPSDPNTTWCLWVTWESVDGVESDPAGGVNGIKVTTGQDVSSLLDALSAAAENTALPYSSLVLRGDFIYVVDNAGANKASLFSIVTAPITVNGVTVPAGVYLASAFIQNGSITTAMIGNAQIDDAKISDLAAGKITAGALAVGSYIESSNYAAGTAGWQINADGTAELSNAIVRGAVYASSGTFAGSLQAATGTFAGALSAATGSFAGSLSAASGTFAGQVSGGSFATGAFTAYAWPASGAGGGCYMDGNGALFGNPNQSGMGWFQITSSGNIYAPNFSIVNGVMTLPNGVIGTAQIASLAVQTANIANLNVDGTKVTGVVYGSVYINHSGSPATQINTIPGRNPMVAVYNVNAAVTVGNGYFTITNNGASAGTFPYTYL